MPVDPDLGGLGQLALLSMVDRFDRRTKRIASARLHFDKGDLVVALHNEIDIAMPTAKAMRYHSPPIAQHPFRRDAFAL